MQRNGGDFLIAAALFLLLLLYSLPSLALQPVQAFAAGARQHNPDTQEARANLAQQQAQADSTLGRVLPGISARGSYTRNQYSSVIDIAPPGQAPQPITVVPSDQWDGSATLRVPLIDLAGFQRVSAAKTSAQASAHQLDATRLQVEGQVVQDYYQVVANLALVTASSAALEVSRESLRLAQARYQAGSAAALEVDRARADVEQQVQQVAAADLQVALAARALESASGVEPELSSSISLSDDLHPEPGLDAFESGLSHLPAVAAASANTSAAEKQADAQRLALAPIIAGTFTERGTNAPGFSSHDWSYQAAVTATWSFDLTNIADIRAQVAAVDAARARELRAVLSSRDSIHREWSTIVAAIARSRSARAGLEAARHAAAQARERYRAGTITQLDLLQAQRDAFNAEVSRIQSDADLVNARAQLRLSSGHSLLTENAGKGTP
jgi:outer membrane protein TolC